MIKCDYCKEDFEEAIWEKGKIYEGIDEHHNPPQFLMKENWKGKMYNLCRKHHRILHNEILKILNRVAGTLKFINSEDWVCKKMTPKKIEEARKEVYDFTEKWISQNN